MVTISYTLSDSEDNPLFIHNCGSRKTDICLFEFTGYACLRFVKSLSKSR